jgi:von Willebrand factor type A domain
MRARAGFAFGIVYGLLVAACGSSGESAFDGGSGDGSSDDGTLANEGGEFADGGLGDGGDSGDNCNAPDMLIVLDRTNSMHLAPDGTTPADTPAGHMLSKWYLAVSAVKALVASPRDSTIRFGLELLPDDHSPLDAAAASCSTLSQVFAGTGSTVPHCVPGQLVVPVGLSTGSAITAALDPETTPLCLQTPIALALSTAQDTLTAITTSIRSQSVVLVTDGAETCGGDPVAVAQGLATAGMKTYVVGFGSAGGGGIDIPTLNNLACAGMTATGFATACVKSGAGYVAVTPAGPALFFSAQDGASLSTALATIASGVCCGCVK